jgi:site-specific DNA-methyltransferase (adenine-specific)
MRKEVIGNATLYLGDCLEIIPTLGKVDAVITDPPYSSGGAFRSDRDRSTEKKYLGAYGKPAAVQIDFSGDNRDALGWGYWATMWLSLCLRRMGRGSPVVVFTDWRQLPNASNVLQAAGYSWRGVGVWDKGSARPMSGRFMHQAEYFVWGTVGAMPWDFEAPCLPGVFKFQSPSAQDREHQTEKPLQLMEEIVRIAPVGGTVLDPFMGSGTTGAACMAQNRPFIGIELEPKYFDIACEKLTNAQRQERLFA